MTEKNFLTNSAAIPYNLVGCGVGPVAVQHTGRREPVIDPETVQYTAVARPDTADIGWA